MTRRSLRTVTRSRKALLALAGAMAVIGPIGLGILRPSDSRAQTRTAPLRFEVASIKRANSHGDRGGFQTMPGGGLRMSGVTLKQLIGFAYAIPEDRISGGPGWAGTETYSIVAKPEHADNTEGRQPAPGSPTWTRMQQRMQTLLTERFHLGIHKDMKVAAVYALVVAKNGPKLKPSEAADDVPPGTMRSRDQINGRAGTMEMLATVLGNWLGRPVEDRTGLTGRYDYKVEYAPEPGGAPGEVASPAGSPAGPSIFTALQEQLGLRLEAARAEVESLVIERAERPSAN